MKATSILTIGCAAIALSVTSCTNFGSPNTYNMNEIGGVQETYYGTVTSVETVKIQANNANAGTRRGCGGRRSHRSHVRRRQRQVRYGGRGVPSSAPFRATRLTRP